MNITRSILENLEARFHPPITDVTSPVCEGETLDI